MAPPQVFINKKTLEKHPEKDKEDGYEDFEPENKQEQETEKEDKSDDCDPENSKDTNGSIANRKARSLSILINIASPILVFTGLAIALVGAFLLDDNRYFIVLGLHMFSLGWLHFLQAPVTKFEQLISSFLARWDIKILDASGEDLVQLRHARILICVILCIANVIFTTLEIHFSNFLFKKNECYNYRCNSVSYGLQTACLIFSICLALPWPLLLLWLTNNETRPCQETLTDMLQKEKVQMKDKEEDNDISDPDKDNDEILTYISSLVFMGLGFALVGAFLWNDDEPEYLYLLALGLHLLSIGCLFSVRAMSKFEQIIASFLTRWDNYEQPISGNLANARILIGTTLSITNLIFTALEMHTLITAVQNGWYGLRTAGLIISICLALPWPLLVLWLTKRCNNTLSCKETLRQLNDELQEMRIQVKKTIVSLLPSLQDQLSPPSFNINVPTSASPLPGCFLQQTAVITIMLLANTMFAAQLTDAGMTSANVRTANILERLEDPEESYISFEHGNWLPLGLPRLSSSKTKLAGIVAAPVTFVLCLPLFILNRRLSFASLFISLLFTIPLGLFYAFLSICTTNWLILFVPSSVPFPSLALRIVIAVAPAIIAALFFALNLSYLENFAKRNKPMEKEQTKTTLHWTLASLSLIILMVTVCGLILITTNLMQRLPSIVPDCSSNNSCHYSRFYQPVTAFVTFGIAHLGLSMTIMVIAFLLFLVGHKISGLTSWLLGCCAFGMTIATIVYYYLELREFMEPMEFDIYNTEFIFINNAAIGLLVGSVFMCKGCKAFVELVTCLLKALLVLPLLVVLAILAIARGIVSLLTQSLGSPPPLHNPQQQQGPGTSIDQIAVETRVTYTFTQHWISVGGHLRVLLLDFDGKFTLLIPNIEPGNVFRITEADVEVRSKEVESGQQRTFIKFIFRSPALEIEAPIINDETVGYQLLQQNGACVFLGRIYDILPRGPGGPMRPQDQQTETNMDKNETCEQV